MTSVCPSEVVSCLYLVFPVFLRSEPNCVWWWVPVWVTDVRCTSLSPWGNFPWTQHSCIDIHYILPLALVGSSADGGISTAHVAFRPIIVISAWVSCVYIMAGCHLVYLFPWRVHCCEMNKVVNSCRHCSVELFQAAAQPSPHYDSRKCQKWFPFVGTWYNNINSYYAKKAKNMLFFCLPGRISRDRLKIDVFSVSRALIGVNVNLYLIWWKQPTNNIYSGTVLVRERVLNDL